MKKRTVILTALLLVFISASVMLAITGPGPGVREDISLPRNGVERTEEKEYSLTTEVTGHDHAENGDQTCVFKTVFEGKFNFDSLKYQTPESVKSAIDRALQWIVVAQLADGGWGAGSHYQQDITDPQKVPSDPATTAIVSMALLRCEHTPEKGKYSDQLNRAIEFLLLAVESSGKNELNITKLENTQPQVKLGHNIDVVLTSQFLTNLLGHISNDAKTEERVRNCITICVDKIERAQQTNGSFSGGSWAGVLQSSFATTALESAEGRGIAVDSVVLSNAREYQSGNYDIQSGEAKLEDAAGVMLYSISSSSRNTAQDANFAKKQLSAAKEEGKVSKEAVLTPESLEKAGMSEAEALKYYSSYQVNESAKVRAMDQDVMVGFGNNGGEEFLSFLQTGEGMIVSNDNTWKTWYDKVSKTLLNIQEEDGNWQGHHCITSPVFCTATSILILSINNDVEELALMGHK